MKMLDVENKSSIRNLQLYLTESEAKQLQAELSKLLSNPEANEHFHLMAEGSGREISCSIITPNKMSNISSYTKLEQQILTEK